MKTFRNINFTLETHDSECVYLIACQSEQAPSEIWVECDNSYLKNLKPLFKQDGVQYWGHL